MQSVLQPFEQGCKARVKAAARNQDLLQAVVEVPMLLMHEQQSEAVSSIQPYCESGLTNPHLN